LATFIIRRIALTVIVVIIVSFLAFSLIHVMPGDPAATMLGLDARPEQIQALRHELWLDRPFLVQYGHWAYNALHGDLGVSLMYKDPIVDIIKIRLPITLYLAAIAFVISTFLGIFLGIICAIRRGSLLDQLVSVVANVGIAIPVFWLGIMMIYLFGLKLGWLPLQGWTSPLENYVKSTKQAIIPVILLAIPGIAVLTRQTRSSMLEVVRQDYIRTAYAKGLKERYVIVRHALKNALIPVVTLLGLQVRVLVGGSILVETVCNIPGMGRLLTTAAFNKDFLVVQAGVLIVGTIVCLVNLIVDISYGWLDPRVRFQ